MIYEMEINNYSNLIPLLKSLKLNQHPVINGIIKGNNLGKVYVDNTDTPKVALIWAKMEMFYLIGNHDNDLFNNCLEDFIVHTIKPEALAIGDNHFNLEIYPFNNWGSQIQKLFSVSLNRGVRVPFRFIEDLFYNYRRQSVVYPEGYEIVRIDEDIIEKDADRILESEILKFWNSTEMFIQTGLGYCVINKGTIIGSCISVFVSEKEFEIGINTYSVEHRGKGLATLMAKEFIQSCISNGLNPHWTTEEFRKDSIAIAKKIGFIQEEEYEVYFLPFIDLIRE